MSSSNWNVTRWKGTHNKPKVVHTVHAPENYLKISGYA